MTDPDESRLTHIVAISEDGLSVLLDGERHFLSWNAVSSVSGGLSKRDEMLVVSIGIDSEDGERAFLIAEGDPLWADLTQFLHVGLPIAPLEAWAMGMASFPGAYQLYKRANGHSPQ